MFKKVLLAEDIDTISSAVDQILNQLGITDIEHVKYCDDALLKIKKAVADDSPFDLLISDLSFEPDHRQVQLKNGEELIRQIKITQPNIKVIVYSVEDKPHRIKSLFEKQNINAFIHKGRKSIDQLKTAIQQIQNPEAFYISPELEYLLKDTSIRQIDDFDIQLIKQLAVGISQDEMEIRFKELGITPNSKSTIEKRIGKLKDHFRANNTVHLIAIAKDLGIA